MLVTVTKLSDLELSAALEDDGVTVSENFMIEFFNDHRSDIIDGLLTRLNKRKGELKNESEEKTKKENEVEH